MISNITTEENYPVGQVEKDVFGYPNYCAKNVMIRPTLEKDTLTGKLCCCNEDWCNANYEKEPVNDYDIIVELDGGTVEEYEILKKIARKYGIS
uniref:Uncharacterized protein n=1 Tax=Setaria digitata TaxID=48799 RepID=A0A915PYC4_9BILA